MGKMRGLVVIVWLLSSSSIFGASIDLVQEYSFQIPMADTIRQIAFGDIDNDGTPEALARTDHAFALYSILNDSILFQQSYSPDSFVTYVMIGDVNRDHVKDVVIGRSCANPLDSFFYEISAFSGQEPFQFLGDFRYDIGGGAVDPQDSRIYFVKSVDINNDGTDEVLFSWDRQNWSSDFSFEYSAGYTTLFNSFPDSISWGKYEGMWRYVSFRDFDSSRRVLVEPRSYSASFPPLGGHSSENATVSLLDSLGSLTLLGSFVPDSYYDPWCQTPDVWIMRVAPVCAGHISGNANSVEYVAHVDAHYGCSPALIQGHQELQLRRFRSDGINSILYTLQDVYGDFAYHPLLPGYFLELGGVYNDLITRARLFRGVDGKEMARSVPVNLSPRWVIDFPDEIPRVMVKNVNHLTISSLQISTDFEGPDPDTDLPSHFTLNRPYPNPFNAEVSIPLSLPKRTKVQVEVFNLLGQKVAELWNGSMNPGEQVVRWNAGELPSAVYFILATAIGETKTAKIVLLK